MASDVVFGAMATKLASRQLLVFSVSVTHLALTKMFDEMVNPLQIRVSEVCLGQAATGHQHHDHPNYTQHDLQNTERIT